jgi:hypothetical protein
VVTILYADGSTERFFFGSGPQAGAFDNNLNSITVRADERGRARVKFTATPGTINDIHILAASPVTSGRMRYLLNVRSGSDGRAMNEGRRAEGGERRAFHTIRAC